MRARVVGVDAGCLLILYDKLEGKVKGARLRRRFPGRRGCSERTVAPVMFRKPLLNSLLSSDHEQLQK